MSPSESEMSRVGGREAHMAGRDAEAPESESRRIALFTRYLTMGGIQKIMAKLANEFVARGYHVDFVLAKGKGGVARELKPEVRVIDLQCNRVWTALPGLLRYIRRARPDVLLAGEDSSNIVALWAKLLLRREFRCFVSVHQNTSAYAASDQMWYARILPLLTRIFYRAADGIITVSRGIRDDLVQIAPGLADKATVIYNPVIDDDILAKAREAPEHPWMQDGVAPVIIGVGRLTRQKNFDLLLRAFARVCTRRDARLILLGDGNRRAHLEQRIAELGLEDRVDLHGFTSNPYAYMANASLFVLSSVYEGLPTVLIEALACGCPVVSTNCPSGPREALEEGRWGALVPMHDDDALANAIQESLDTPHDRQELRRRGRTFNVEASIGRYLVTLFPKGAADRATPVNGFHEALRDAAS